MSTTIPPAPPPGPTAAAIQARLHPADGGPPLAEDAAIPIPSNASFEDVLRSLNPLHHLPGVGSLYRAATGETVLPAIAVIGATILGGPIAGLVTAGLSVLREASPPPVSPAMAARRYAGTPHA
ncbi:hypothetical protein C8P66_12235 [Humitalea rosea]|uniref:Uncharacterized protein n=1 Tax=Humitalea rosea TaxID=990373 RepID=A0A2W7I405_9PROT|nr:hypothetical protein [Humitalea rosea]PZW41048.1 hypothetical protein C8P66_12235 [Humitalea rosea]